MKKNETPSNTNCTDAMPSFRSHQRVGAKSLSGSHLPPWWNYGKHLLETESFRIIDAVRVMKKIQTESKGVKPIKCQGERTRLLHLSADVEYRAGPF